MARYVLTRLGLAVPMLLSVCAIGLMLLHLMPGDPAIGLLGEYATPERVEAVEEEYRLDDPIPVQYVAFIERTATGDFGSSARSDLPVADILQEKLAVSLQLVGASLFVALTVGLAAGAVAGTRPGSLVDRVVTAGATLAHSVPHFWLAIVLVIVFAIELEWLPVLGYVSLFESPIEGMRRLVLPACALGLPAATEIARQFRASLAASTNALFVRTALAGGLTRRRVFTHYVVPAALPPVLTTVGVIVVRLFGQTVIIETVFGIPGLGRVLVNSMQSSDIPVIMGAVVVFGLITIGTNIVVDLLHLVLNPRLRFATEAS